MEVVAAAQLFLQNRDGEVNRTYIKPALLALRLRFIFFPPGVTQPAQNTGGRVITSFRNGGRNATADVLLTV